MSTSIAHVKVFDPRRRVVVGSDDEDQQEKAAAGRLEDDDGYYYWLCPDCFHHIRETLPVVVDGSDFNGNIVANESFSADNSSGKL